MKPILFAVLAILIQLSSGFPADHHNSGKNAPARDVLVLSSYKERTDSKYYKMPGAEERLAGKNYGEFGPYYEGDIMLTEEEVEQRVSNKNAPTIYKNDLWTNNTLYFNFVQQFTQDEVNIFFEGVELFNSHFKNCVKIEQRTDQSVSDNFVAVQYGDGCASRFGMQGGAQPMELAANGCFWPGIIAHEFIHSFGFDHEQKRPDRADYVDYFPENLEDPRDDFQFQMYKDGQVELYGLEYDYGSIMHYPADAFGRPVNGKDLITLIPKKKGVTIGQRKDLSANDVAMVKARYGCQ